MADTDPRFKPIEFGGGQVAFEPTDLVDVILEATNKQVVEKSIADADAREDFVMSTDALNYWRMAWRCSVEWGTRELEKGIAHAIKSGICAARGYDLDDLDSAIQATKERVRLPFGWSALDLAWMFAQQEPLRLLDPTLFGRAVPTTIASIAYHLQLLRDKEPILLPIDHLRVLLKQRKIVVSGAVQRLVGAKILDYADKNYHTGKAREFRFVGVQGEHYVRADQGLSGS